MPLSKGVWLMRSVFVAVWCLLTAVSLVAQSDRGTITGTVSDPAGAVVPNAPIQARNVETGVVYDSASSTTGNYTIPQLPVGTYEVTVTVSGFKKYTRTGLTVQVAQTSRVDISLEVGSATESVTVSAEASLLKTESGELSHTVNLDQLTDLPLFVVTGGIRNPNQIMDLIPGTYSAGDIRVNGAPANSQSYRIEGQDASNSGLPSFPSQNQAGVDAIQEIAVQTSNFAAEYGQVGGGVLNVTMRSGTNQFHGSGYEYFVNEFLNAGQPYTDDGTGHNIRPRTRRNDFGYTVGGPVWIPKVYNGRDKTFFFVSWEEYRVSMNNANDPHTVPTPAFRNGRFQRGDSSQRKVIGTDPLGNTMLQGMIYDPRYDAKRRGPVGSDQFVGQQDPDLQFRSHFRETPEYVPVAHWAEREFADQQLHQPVSEHQQATHSVGQGGSGHRSERETHVLLATYPTRNDWRYRTAAGRWLARPADHVARQSSSRLRCTG